MDPDEACVEYILQFGHLSHCITYLDLNRAFQNPEIYKMILSSKAKNDVVGGPCWLNLILKHNI